MRKGAKTRVDQFMQHVTSNADHCNHKGPSLFFVWKPVLVPSHISNISYTVFGNLPCTLHVS